MHLIHTLEATFYWMSIPGIITNGATFDMVRSVPVYGASHPGAKSEHPVYAQLISSEFLKKADHPGVILLI